MIPRPRHFRKLRSLLKSYPVVGVIGPRQIGKTTIARQFAKQQKSPTTHFDLEDSRDLARLSDPNLALEPLRGLIVLDEIHEGDAGVEMIGMNMVQGVDMNQFWPAEGYYDYNQYWYDCAEFRGRCQRVCRRSFSVRPHCQR